MELSQGRAQHEQRQSSRTPVAFICFKSVREGMSERETVKTFTLFNYVKLDPKIGIPTAIAQVMQFEECYTMHASSWKHVKGSWRGPSCALHRKQKSRSTIRGSCHWEPKLMFSSVCFFGPVLRQRDSVKIYPKGDSPVFDYLHRGKLLNESDMIQKINCKNWQ